MDSVRLLWSLTNSGLGTSITGSGNSGSWSSSQVDAETLVDLRWSDDVILMASAASITSSPTLSVFLDFYDDQGNLYAGAGTGPVLTAVSAKQVSFGSHAPTSAAYMVLPSWGRVSWTCTGGSISGAEIAIYGR